MRRALGAFWLLAGSLHFIRPQFYLDIMPRFLHRWDDELVAASGVAEIAGGLLVLNESTKRIGRWWLLATLAAVYPANVQMALDPGRYPHLPAWALWARLPFQFVFGWLVWRGTE
jgi:uncharacterized membrane protein